MYNLRDDVYNAVCDAVGQKSKADHYEGIVNLYYDCLTRQSICVCELEKQQQYDTYFLSKVWSLGDALDGMLEGTNDASAGGVPDPKAVSVADRCELSSGLFCSVSQFPRLLH